MGNPSRGGYSLEQQKSTKNGSYFQSGGFSFRGDRPIVPASYIQPITRAMSRKITQTISPRMIKSPM